MPKDTRRILRGVRMGGKTITDPDELESGMTQEQVDDLKERGAIMGDWKPGGKGFTAASPRADRKNRKKQRQAMQAAPAGPGINEDAITELEWLRKENQQLKAQVKDFYQDASKGKDTNAAKVQDQGKSDGKDANANKSEQPQAASQAVPQTAVPKDQGQGQQSQPHAHQHHQGGGKKK